MEARSSISKILVVVLIISMLLMATSCGKIKDKIGEKFTEKVTEKVLGEDVEINGDGFKVNGEDGSFETGEDLDWPEDVMGDLPEFKGNITTLWKDEKSCSIVFADGDEDDVKDYAEELEDIDFEDGIETDQDDIFMFSGTRESEGDTITITYSGTDDTVTIFYNKEQ
ncbi:MAG: hypothetical protein CVU84_10455 [Firmicutes bacterium HGW-Firmicutes-1]|jgi:hypothetical protein|nr:MAG: hypothetical protein CVU84_10455 [Firmicutes bacterium HGW-Firmicutes-1]